MAESSSSARSSEMDYEECASPLAEKMVEIYELYQRWKEEAFGFMTCGD